MKPQEIAFVTAAAILAPIVGAAAAIALWYIVMVQLLAPIAAALNALSVA